MNLPGERKRAVMDRIFAMLNRSYDVVPMRDHAAQIDRTLTAHPVPTGLVA